MAKSSRRRTETKTKPKTKEMRAKGPRVPIDLLVDYRANGTYLFDFCKDLGEGGIFIATEEPKEPTSTLELTFTLPDSKETLTTKGTVMWVQEPITERPELTAGMGIQFESFTTEDRETLESFIDRYRPRKTA